MNYKIIILLTLTFLVNIAPAQNSYIKGVVVDKKTNNKLPYAVISYNNDKYGGYCNEQGVFDMQINNNVDTLKFSYVGYKVLKVASKKLLSHNSKIYLEPYNIELAEAVVKPHDVHKIMKKAVSNYWKHIVKKPYLSKVYFNETTKDSTGYLMFTDGLSYLLSSGYKYRLGLYCLFTYNMRFSDRKEQWIKTTNKYQNKYYYSPQVISNLFTFRYVERVALSKNFLSKSYWAKAQYNIDSLYSKNNSNMAIVSFKSPGHITGKFFINLDINEIVGIDAYCSIQSYAFNKWLPHQLLQFRYIYSNKMLYLNSMNTKYTFKGYTYSSKLNIIEQGFVSKNTAKRINNLIWGKIGGEKVIYNKQEWVHHNYISNKVWKTLNHDLGSKIKLEKQFENNVGKVYENVLHNYDLIKRVLDKLNSINIKQKQK